MKYPLATAVRVEDSSVMAGDARTPSLCMHEPPLEIVASDTNNTNELTPPNEMPVAAAMNDVEITDMAMVLAGTPAANTKPLPADVMVEPVASSESRVVVDATETAQLEVAMSRALVVSSTFTTETVLINWMPFPPVKVAVATVMPTLDAAPATYNPAPRHVVLLDP